MKTSPLKFNPGRVEKVANGGTLEVLPAITMPDGSEICLMGFDRACGPNQHKRRKQNLPTFETRNALGAELVAMHGRQQQMRERLEELYGDDRLTYPAAYVGTNVALALVQVELTAKVHTLEFALGLPLSKFPLKKRRARR